MSKTFKAKSVLIAIFTMIMALSLVVGIGFNGSAEAKAEDETATTKWQTSRSTPLQELNGSGIQYQNISATIMNGTNILDVPGRTVKFQFRMNGVTDPWQGFAFLNGQSNWKAVNWPGVNTGCDTLPHIIINPAGAAQIYGNTAGNYGLSGEGIEGMVAITEGLHTVEIHIGDGDTDMSYMKIDGSLLTQQHHEGVSALSWATVDKFTEGCYFAVTYNANPDCVVMLGEYNAPYTEGASAGFKYVDLSSGTAPEGLEFVAKNITGTAKLYVNGTEVTDTTTYTVTDVEGGKKYVLNQNFWTVYLSSLKKSTAIYVEAENGKGAVVATVQLAPPPVWKGESYKEIKSGDSLSYTFEYTGAALTADTITVKTGVRTAKNAIVPETDYTLTNEGTTYTIAFTSEYLAKAFETYKSFAFSVTVGEDTLNGDVYCIPEAEGWYARSVDLAGDATTEDNYINFNLNKFSADTLASRLIYNEGLDVTKPIIVEFAKLDSKFTWALFGVMDSRKTLDYFSNETTTDSSSKLMALFFGEDRSDIQKFYGFEAGASTNAEYTNTAWAYKNIVVEMYFGATKEEGYFRINGTDCGTPSVVQSDFKGGKAYIGFFNNYTAGSFDFKVNKNVNGIGVISPNTEASFKQDLANATDLVLDVIGTDGNVEVVNSKGTVSTAEEIAYANGKLTIKAAYFARLAFTKNDVLTIKDKTSGTATEIKMAYTTSNMAGSVVAFATKGNVKDAVFALPEGITEVSSVSKGDLELTAANFSVSDGKLTIDKSQINDTVKMNEFIVISGNKVVTAYVYVDEFANGYAKGGSGTIEADGKAFVMTNAAKATPEKVFDLKTGFVMKIDFQAIATYYHSTNNYQNPTAITFNFYDPYSGLTLIYKIYANYEADDANATDTALFEEYNLVDSEGRTVSGVSGTRPLSMVDSQNTAALGAHKVKFEAAGEGLKITVDDGRATTIASLGNFNANANILTVESSASVGDKESKVAFKLYDLNEEFDYESVKVEEKKPDDSSSSGEATGCNEGCKGSATATGLFGVLTVVAYTIVRKKRG